MKEKKATTRSANLTKSIKFNSSADKGQFNKIISALHLTPAHQQQLHELYHDIDAHPFDDQKTTVFLAAFDTEVDGIKASLPHKVQKKIKVLRKLQTHLGVIDKLKTGLPLLNYMLIYEMADTQREPFLRFWFEVLFGELLVEESDGRRGLGDVTPITDLEPTGDVFAGITIYKTPEGNIQFTCGAAICVDGAPTAYGPNNNGSDNNSSAGHAKGDFKAWKKDSNGNEILVNGEKVAEYWDEDYWWAVVTDKWDSDDEREHSRGKPLTQLIDGEEYYISTTAYVYSLQKDNVQKRYVNANNVPFSVISSGTAKKYGLKLGDLVHVTNHKTGKSKWTGYMETRFADNKIGEVSLAAAEALGVENTNPRKGGQSKGITYVFYPNTGPLKRNPNDPSNFLNDAEAKEYIERVGKQIKETGKLPSTEDRWLPKRS